MSLLTKIKNGITEYRIPKADILGVLERRFGAYQKPAEVTGLKPLVESTIKAEPQLEKENYTRLIEENPRVSNPEIEQVRKIVKEYPFDSSILDSLKSVKVSFDKKNRGGAQYIQRGQDTFDFFNHISENLAQRIAQSSLAQRTDKPNIKIKQIYERDVAHEILHDAFINSAISPITPYSTRIKSKKLTENEIGASLMSSFLKEWDNNKIKEERLQIVDEILRTAKDDEGKLLYEGIFDEGDEQRLATERFAYLGTEFGRGIVSIPQKFRKYYKGILK